MFAKGDGTSLLTLYLVLIMPALFLLIAVLADAGFLWFLLLLSWLGAGLLIALLPHMPEDGDRH